MSIDDKEILYAVKDALCNDSKLAGYVKSFAVGDMNISRKLFPFIAVGNLECNITPRTIGMRGYDMYSYKLEIRACVRSLTPGEAFGGEHGILQLCDDVAAVARTNDFGVFSFPAEVLAVSPGYKYTSGGGLWSGRVIIRGGVKVQRFRSA